MKTNSTGSLPLRKPDYTFSRARFSPAQDEAFSRMADVLKYRLVGYLVDKGEEADYESCVTDAGLRFVCFVMDSELCTIFGFPIRSEIAMSHGENSDIAFNENLMRQMQSRPAAELERIADELEKRPEALVHGAF